MVNKLPPLAGPVDASGEPEHKPDPRYFDEKGNYLDGPHWGKDCPKGMVQVAFLGANPKQQFSPYSWKPEEHVFIEISIDGEHWRIDIGDYEASCPGGKRRGLHINGPFDLCADKHSVNAVDLYRGEAQPAAAVPSSPARPSGDDLSVAFKQGWDAHAALPPSSPVADSPTTKDVDYAIKALDAAALWEPAAMLKLADTLEQPPHYAMCESQYLRGIAQRIQAASAPSPSAGAAQEIKTETKL